jgi:transposase
MNRKAYPSDVSFKEWSLLAPYLTLMTEDAPLRADPLREVCTAKRYIVRSGAPWRMMPSDLLPWQVVCQQARRWIDAGVFESRVLDLRVILRLAGGRDPSPSAVILDSCTMQSTPESSARAGYDGARRRKGSKVHIAVEADASAMHFPAPTPTRSGFDCSPDCSDGVQWYSNRPDPAGGLARYGLSSAVP